MGIDVSLTILSYAVITVVAMSYSKWPDMKQGSDSMLHFLPMYHSEMIY